MEELIIQAKQGNKDAFSELISHINNDLYLLAKTRLYNDEDIKDAIQNTLINAYLSLSNLKHNKYFKTWITKILFNECNKIYNHRKNDIKILNKCIYDYENSIHTASKIDIDFDAIKEILTDKENEIFFLFHQQGLTTKQISQRLNINENTIKTRLRSARVKLKHKYSSIVATILIIFFITTGVVFGKDIINFIKDLFNLNDIGINNNGVLNAIENKEWIQNIDMDYINANENYNIKLDYLLIDDINLYIVINCECNTSFGNYNRFTLDDLIVLDENNNIIYDSNLANTDTVAKIVGWKNVYYNNTNIKELFYLISDSYTYFNKLKFRFSKLTLYNSDNGNLDKMDINFEPKEIIIEIEDKFINRNSIQYEIINKNEIQNLDYNIEKALMTDTGFYAVVTTDSTKLKFIMANENGEKFNCSNLCLTITDDNKYLFLITSEVQGDTIYIINNKSEVKLSKTRK